MDTERHLLLRLLRKGNSHLFLLLRTLFLLLALLVHAKSEKERESWTWKRWCSE